MALQTTPLLLETIKIENGTVHNLQYHQQRCNQSRQALYLSKDTLNLNNYISPPPRGLYRCRVIYAQKIQSIEYIPYSEKSISTLKVVPSTIDYRFKYANREELTQLAAKYPHYDDVIIEKDGYLTDTTIANIAFFDGQKWLTPAQPLLKGTMRQKLLDAHLLEERFIKKEELSHYKNVALINAMIGFKILNEFTIE